MGKIMYIMFDSISIEGKVREIGEELHCHSVYSEQDGVSSVRDIIDFAAANGMSAVAITDHATACES